MNTFHDYIKDFPEDMKSFVLEKMRKDNDFESKKVEDNIRLIEDDESIQIKELKNIFDRYEE